MANSQPGPIYLGDKVRWFCLICWFHHLFNRKVEYWHNQKEYLYGNPPASLTESQLTTLEQGAKVPTWHGENGNA